MLHLDFINYKPFPDDDIIEIEVLFDEEDQRVEIVRSTKEGKWKQSIGLLDYLIMSADDEEDILIKDLLLEKLEIRAWVK
jgi:hypothetical protein